MAFNRWNTMLVDPTPPQCIVKASDCSGDNRFAAGACGHVAVGSDKGVVRLCKEPGRLHSPGNSSVNLGNTPVLALDVAPDDG
jgi:hypothetical protein